MRARQVALRALLVCLPGLADAFEFRPTDAEFQSWPDYCRARYMTLDIGRMAPVTWARMVGTEDVNRARLLLGDLFNFVHHYCAGTILLRRARVEQDAQQRMFDLKAAKEEMTFTRRYLTPESVLYGELFAQLATVHYEMGESQEALQLLEAAISAHPEDPVPYSAMAIIHRANGRLDLATDILKRGDSAAQGKSAEICYNLGLILIEAGQPGSAVPYARQAYALGYPLPGLRRRLERLGYWDQIPD